MTTVVFELFEALKKAGMDEETARKAAQAVGGIEDKQQLATRLDVETLRRDMAEITHLRQIGRGLRDLLDPERAMRRCELMMAHATRQGRCVRRPWRTQLLR